MKITRNQFLKLIPAAALTLTGCGSKAQPANTESLVFSHHYKLDYAQQFTADCYEGGYTMLTIAESDTRFLVVPEDAAEVDSLPADVTVLRQPVENVCRDSAELRRCGEELPEEKRRELYDELYENSASLSELAGHLLEILSAEKEGKKIYENSQKKQN